MNDVLPTPAQIMAFLDQAAVELDQLGKDLEAAHISLGDAEATWEAAKDIALLEVVEDYERRQAAGENVRLPGEDVRLAMARKRTEFQVYGDYIKAKRLVKGLEDHCRKLEKAVSARQSTLKTMREGFGLEGYGTAEPQTESGSREANVWAGA